MNYVIKVFNNVVVNVLYGNFHVISDLRNKPRPLLNVKSRLMEHINESPRSDYAHDLYTQLITWSRFKGFAMQLSSQQLVYMWRKKHSIAGHDV